MLRAGIRPCSHRLKPRTPDAARDEYLAALRAAQSSRRAEPRGRRAARAEDGARSGTPSEEPEGRRASESEHRTEDS